jgi:aspartyl-tRNA(Asn)/glutamyl-tRNA(Gln) amidotransferase subunit A
LPVGLQVMAPPLADDRLYRVGAALEAALQSAWGGPLLDRVAETGVAR